MLIRGTGMTIEGRVSIEHNCTIIDAETRAIEIRPGGELVIGDFGLLKIHSDDDTTGQGIHNRGSLSVNRFSPTFSGRILIKDIYASGIVNSLDGLFINKGLVEIEAILADPSNCVLVGNDASFTNDTTGVLNIDGVGDDGSSTGIVGSGSATIINHGMIEITDVAQRGINLISLAHFLNTGRMDIHGFSINAISNAGSGFDNHGFLNLGSPSSLQLATIHNRSTFNNSDQGLIKNTDEATVRGNAILNEGIFTNAGLIDISNIIVRTGVFCQAEESSFINTGTLKVDSCDRGISMRNGATFTNSDSICLEYAVNYGIFGEDSVEFTNSGFLQIKSSGGISLKAMSLSEASEFINGSSGEIHINDTEGTGGLELSSDASFVNEGIYKYLFLGDHSFQMQINASAILDIKLGSEWSIE